MSFLAPGVKENLVALEVPGLSEPWCLWRLLRWELSVLHPCPNNKGML